MRLTLQQRAAKKARKAARAERTAEAAAQTAEKAAARAAHRLKVPDGSARIARHPLYECRMTENLWQEGLGYVLVARELPDGRLMLGAFLVDTYCLGVKDAFVRRLQKDQYRERFLSRHDTRRIAPEYACKLVYASAHYAAGLGFAPHLDFVEAREVLAGIDPDACDETFHFGDSGKPHFICGPHDSRSRVSQILSTLRATVGPDGFRHTVPEPVHEISAMRDPDGEVHELPPGTKLITYGGEQYITNLPMHEIKDVMPLLTR